MAKELATGTRLSHYEVISSIGAGGMGQVYLTEDVLLRRKVALKVLLPELTKDEDRVRRFQQEARAASALNHPNIITIYEIGQIDSYHYIATEYISGPTLRKHLAHNRLDFTEILDIALQVASALTEAHSNGIVHRDIKPENIMLRSNGLVKILDFGLAKLTEESTSARNATASDMVTVITVDTDPGTVMGTVTYMSPEQTRAQEVDVRTDIFSFGVVLYEMVAGTVPFYCETTSDTIAAILRSEPAPLTQSRLDTPAELQRIITKMLRKDRDTRYQNVQDLMIDLKSLKRELDLTSSSGRHMAASTASGLVIPSTGSGSRRIRESAEQKSGSHIADTVTLYKHTTSSAEYIVSEIKRHKFKVLSILALLIVVIVGAVGYKFYYGNHTIESVAVLPFINASGDPNNDYVSDGLSESLIDQLSQLPGLKVIARSSSFKYRGKDVDPQTAARELGVHALITGTVMQRGNELQIRADLVDVQDNRQIWGERYNRNLTDIQAVQKEIARMITEKLRLHLTGEQEQALTKRPTQSAEAYQQYLSGMFYRQKGRSDDVRKALDYYNQAVTLDPNFALAWVGVATTTRSLTLRGAIAPDIGVPAVKSAVDKALQIDPTLADAHVALATIIHEEWDWAGAEREFRRAMELNPNLADAHSGYATYLSAMGRQTDALSEIRRAEGLDPLQMSYRSSEGNILRRLHRYDEAIARLQGVVKLEPDFIAAHIYLAFTYGDKKMYSQAIAEYQNVVSLEGETTYTRSYMGYTLAQMGKREEALAILDRLKTSKQYVSPTDMATIYAGLGDKESALESLQKGFDNHDSAMRNIKTGMYYDVLRSDQRFIDIVRKMGLTP